MSKKHLQNTPKAKPNAVVQNPKAARNLKISLGLIIAAFAFILYSQSISFDYTMDDPFVLKSNSITTQGLKAIPTLLKTDRLYGYFHQAITPEYRPMPMILYAIEWQFFPDSPHAFHFANVLLFAITCGLLFLMLCLLFQNAGRDLQSRSYLFPFICALLYAAHPIHTEVVDSIKSMDEMLCFLFAIGSMYFVIKYVDDSSIRNLITGGFLFFGCLLSKENGLTFLILIPFIVFVFRAIEVKKLRIIVASLAGIALIYFAIRHSVVGHIETKDSYNLMNRTFFLAHDFFSREATAFYILLRYILLLIFPHPLSFDYSFNQIPIQTMKDIPAIISMVILFAIGIYAVINIRKKSLLSFSILFFLISISVASNVFIIIGCAMGERFLYVPSLGFCMAVTWLLIRLTKADKTDNNPNTFKQLFAGNKMLFVVVFILVGLYSVKTISRSRDWKDNYTLFSNDVLISDKSAQTHYCLGNALLYDKYPAATDAEMKNKYNEQAIAEFTKTLSIFGGFPDVYASLAQCYEQKGAYQNELSLLDSAIKMYPDNANFYARQTAAYLQTGKPQEAIAAGEKAVKSNPDYQPAYANLGLAYYSNFEMEKAQKYLSKATQMNHNDANSMYYLGLVYSATKDTANARLCMEAANQLRSGNRVDETVTNQLGMMYDKNGQYDKAIALYEEKLSKENKHDSVLLLNISVLFEKDKQYDKELSYLDSTLKYAPHFAEAYNTKGVALMYKSRFQETIVECEKALKIKPNFAKAYTNIGGAYSNLKQYSKAIEFLNKAISLDSTDAQPLQFLSITYQNMGDNIKAKTFAEKANNMQRKQ